MNTILRWSLVLIVLLTALQSQESGPDRRQVSPFRGMRPMENGIEVQVLDDGWVGLESIAGVDTATLLAEGKRLHGTKAWKRITEDLPALMDAIGHRMGEAVDVEVRDPGAEKARVLRAVKLTTENRQRLLRANREADAGAAAVPETLSAEDAKADLEALRALLDEEFAYRELRDVDLSALLRKEAEFLGDATVARAELALAVDRILRAFGDGHSRIQPLAPPPDAVFLPFLVQEVDGGHAAFLADRSEFVDATHPFVAAIDGVPLERWLELARSRGTQGSAAMQAREAERGLRELGTLRSLLKVPASKEVKVSLEGKSGKKEVSLPVASRKPTYGAWPRSETRMLDGKIGYLRIAEMKGEPEFLDGLDAAMKSFRGAKGLVIDVRGNGGGSRDALRRLAPYFLSAKADPVVGNVAAVLLSRARPAGPDALADRGLFPVEWSGWTNAQRTAISKFAKTFEPSWTPPLGKFSDWHYLVLDRADNPKAAPFEGRVVVLVDRGCFSATDIFAAALGALPQVTLVGEPTSGGSGRAGSHRLPRSGIELQLSTMASYRPDGVLFEGNGVEPDVLVKCAPGDLVGRTDEALERARELLAK